MPDLKWKLAEPNDGLVIETDNAGVWIRELSGPITDPHHLSAKSPKTRLGRVLPTTVLQLIDLGVASLEKGAVVIPHPEFARLEQLHRIDAFDGMVPWAPFTIEIETTRWPGDDSFRYFLKFYAGRQVVDPVRLGSFVSYNEVVHRLDLQTYSLVEAITSFNSLPKEQKLGGEAFIRFSQIRDLAEGVGAQLDEFLSKERVIVPSSIGLDLVVEPNNRISFAPKIDGVPQDAFREAFMAADDIAEVYSMDDSSGGRIRVVLDEPQREVLKRMQRVRHVGGTEKAEVLRDPASVFDGVAGSVNIGFGPRVQGVGDFPFVARPFLHGSSTGVFVEDPESSEHGPVRKLDAGLKTFYANGEEEDIRFASREELLRFLNDAKASLENGKRVIQFRGKSIPVDEQLVSGVSQQVSHLSTKRADSVKTQMNSALRFPAKSN
jgi:hypothetical protein